MTPNLNEWVAANIRAELARAGWTQGDLAEVLNISRQAIGQRLNGTTALTLTDVEKIAAALKIDVDKLLRN